MPILREVRGALKFDALKSIIKYLKINRKNNIENHMKKVEFKDKNKDKLMIKKDWKSHEKN